MLTEPTIRQRNVACLKYLQLAELLFYILFLWVDEDQKALANKPTPILWINKHTKTEITFVWRIFLYKVKKTQRTYEKVKFHSGVYILAIFPPLEGGGKK